MSLPWKILFVILLVMVSWLLYRDLTFVNSPPVSSSPLVVTNVIIKTVSPPGSSPSPSLSVKSSLVSVKTNFPASVSSPSKKVLKDDNYLRGSYVYSCVGLEKYVYFNGSLFRVGMPSEFGRVVVIDKFFTICISDDNITTYLLPYDIKQDSRLPSARFTSSADGKREIGSRYYVHTGTDVTE